MQAAKKRIAQLEDELAKAQRRIAAAGGAGESSKLEGVPPERLRAPDGPADDLKRINGIGPGIEEKLNRIGIFHLRQIAVLNEANVVWLDRQLRLGGRLQRQDWIGQARTLAMTPGTEGSGELQPALPN